MTAPGEQIVPTRTKDKHRSTRNPVRLLASYAVDAALAKKARNIVVMDVQHVSGIADYFVICTGESELQTKAIVDSIREDIRVHCHEKPWHAEGADHYQWVVLDYVDLVVHVFSQEKRAFYDLERLWGDAERAVVPDEGSSADVPLLQEDAASMPPSSSEE